mgnify:CR=1 FL=1
MHKEDSFKNRQIGILLVSFSAISFTILDCSVKWLLQTIPFFEVIWLRFTCQTLISAAILIPRNGWRSLLPINWRLQILRSCMLGTMTACNFWSIQFLQLSETSAILFSAPLIVALYSYWFLKHPIRIGQWVAIVIGFIGVLIVVRPTSNAVHPAIFLMVINAFLFAGFNILTRKLAHTETPSSLQWISALGPSLMFFPFVNFQVTIPVFAWIIILFAGVWAAVGHYAMARAYQYADAVTLTPFGYQQIIYMSLFGWILFGDVPALAVFIGAFIIIGSGLYLWLTQKNSAPTVV